MIAVGRNEARLRALGCENFQVADFENGDSLRAALADARTVVSCAHARFVPAILDAAPDTVSRFVLMGSTRCFTRFPDKAAEEVRTGERVFRESGRSGVMLHPTMIYGADAENNLQRIARLLRICPVVPLPAGGRALVQPIHIDDVVACLMAAVAGPAALGDAVVIAGPTPMTYADLVRAVGARIGRRVIVANLPAPALLALAAATQAVPGVPSIKAAEIRRLAEDKSFDIDAMQRRLGVSPMSLDDGLARTFD